MFSNGVSNLFMAPFLVLNLSRVNNAGDLVGNTFITNEGFLDSGGVFSLIDVPGASSTHVFGINNLGQIVGTYTENDGSSHGFLATPISEPAPPLLLTFALTGILIRAGKLVGSRGGGGMPRLARIRSPCRGAS